MKNEMFIRHRQDGAKTVYYEYLRCIACFFVIFNHVKGFFLFMNASGIKQAAYIAMSVITKINVPLFFMVSGALLLKKQEDIVTVLKKRVSRIILVILVFELGIYAECWLYSLAEEGVSADFTLTGFVYGVFARSLMETGAYWYLYAYLGFLLLLPFLQKMAGQMKRSDFYTLLVLRFLILTLLPVCNLVLGTMGYDTISLTGEFSVPLATTAAFFYPLTGYYLDKELVMETWSKGKRLGLIIAALAAAVITCLCVYLGGAADETYLALFDYVLAIAVFLGVKYAATVKFPALSQGRLAKAVCFVGSLTFGIYLLDPYLKLVLYKGYESFAEGFLPSLFASFGWCALSMLLGGAATWLLQWLPLFRSLLGGKRTLS